MSDISIGQKYTFERKSEFFRVLQSRVNVYLVNVGGTGNGRLLLNFKGLGGIAALGLLYVAMLNNASNRTALTCLWVSLAIAKVFVALNLMHDGSHNSFATSKRLNNLAAMSILLLGGTTTWWKKKHVQMHHQYTNCIGFDEDIYTAGLLRLSSFQEWRTWHRFQIFYAPIVYSLLSFYIIFLSDVIFAYTNKTSAGMQSISLQLVQKTIYLALMIGLPASIFGIGTAVIGFTVIQIVFGFLLSSILQVAHISANCNTSTVSERPSKVDWATHQILTTSSFSTDSKLISAILGGLNLQVEHHLFPSIHHMHYPAIQPIVEQTCHEYGLPYNKHKNFSAAFRSHLAVLQQLSKPD